MEPLIIAGNEQILHCKVSADGSRLLRVRFANGVEDMIDVYPGQKLIVKAPPRGIVMAFSGDYAIKYTSNDGMYFGRNINTGLETVPSTTYASALHEVSKAQVEDAS